MYTIGDIHYSFEAATSLLAAGAAVGTVTLAALLACFSTLAATPAQLMRPKAPPVGEANLPGADHPAVAEAVLPL